MADEIAETTETEETTETTAAPTFVESAGNDYDTAAAGGQAPPEQGPNEVTPPAEPTTPATPPVVDPKAPPEGEQASTVKTAEELVTLQQGLDGYRDQLEAYRANLQQVTQDPRFQAAYQSLQNPNQAQPNAAGMSQQGSNQPANPLANIQPETETERQLTEFLTQQQETYQQQRQQDQQTIAQLQRQVQGITGHLDAETEADTDRRIEAAREAVKVDFPDLIDGGKMQQKVEDQAAIYINGAIEQVRATGRGTVPTAQEAMLMAARAEGYDGVNERARQSVLAQARGATGARAETPVGAGPGEPPSFREQAGAAYDEANK